MAKPASEAATVRNGFDTDTVRKIVARIDRLYADLDSERGESMARCKVIRDDIAEVYKEAENKGLPRKELKTVVKLRRFEQKAKRAYEELELDQRANFEMLIAAGGVDDLPLWRAAAQREQRAG